MFQVKSSSGDPRDHLGHQSSTISCLRLVSHEKLGTPSPMIHPPANSMFSVCRKIKMRLRLTMAVNEKDEPGDESVEGDDYGKDVDRWGG